MEVSFSSAFKRAFKKRIKGTDEVYYSLSQVDEV